MVEYSIDLNTVFGSLADETRRDILKRVSKREHSISELAKPYKRFMSFAGIAKHVSILESARLITKRREGKRQIIGIAPKAVKVAITHLEKYEKVWNDRFSALDELLKH